MAASVFMLGKGGTGKTTVAALLAIFCARAGHKVLLISLDPAHNLSDILEKKIKAQPTVVNKGLRAMEVDLQEWVDRYLKRTSDAVRKNYQYLSALSLEKYIDLYRYTPGLDAQGLLMAYQQLISEQEHMDYLIFDMPPTALSLQFFRLPGLSLEWLNRLSGLRNEILEKQKIITRIKVGKHTFEQDKPLAEIRRKLADNKRLISSLQNPHLNSYILVCNPDTLSLNEAADITDRFSTWGFPVRQLVINKLTKPSVGSDELPEQLRNLAKQHLHQSDGSLSGRIALNQFLDGHKQVFAQLKARIGTS